MTSKRKVSLWFICTVLLPQVEYPSGLAGKRPGILWAHLYSSQSNKAENTPQQKTQTSTQKLVNVAFVWLKKCLFFSSWSHRKQPYICHLRQCRPVKTLMDRKKNRWQRRRRCRKSMIEIKTVEQETGNRVRYWDLTASKEERERECPWTSLAERIFHRTAHWRGSSDKDRAAAAAAAAKHRAMATSCGQTRYDTPKRTTPGSRWRLCTDTPLCNPFFFFKEVLYLGYYCIMFPLRVSHLDNMIPSL